MSRTLFGVIALAAAALIPGGAAAATTTTLSPFATFPVAVAAGTQEDPHVGGDLVAYTDWSTAVAHVAVFDRATRTTRHVEPPSSAFDFLPDTDGASVVFTRVGDYAAVMHLDVAGGGVRELAPDPTADRLDPEVGGRTVAWQETRGGVVDLVAADLADGTTTRLTTDAAVDRDVSVSRDGGTLSWTRCDASGCDVHVATKTSSGWSTRALTSATTHENFSDTDGTTVVYDRLADGERNIAWQPVAGGAEHVLSLPGEQKNPTIGNGIVVFEHIDRSLTGANWDLMLVELATGAVYRLTSDPRDDTLNDVSVGPDGTIVVAWTRERGVRADVRAAAYRLPTGPQAPTVAVPAAIGVAATGPSGAAVTFAVTGEGERRQVLAGSSTRAYYNDALGTVLDGTQPQFPLADLAGGDPVIRPAAEPSLAAAAGVLGTWLEADAPAGAAWSGLQLVPRSWAANTETAIVYPLAGPARDVRAMFGVDNGLFVWLNGTYHFGAVEPFGATLGEYAVALGDLQPGTSYLQVLREDHGGFTDYIASVTGLVRGALVPTCTHASGAVFPVGSTTVTCTVTDANGVKASASFTITVTASDTTPPGLTVPADIAVDATSPSGAAVEFAATATDAFDATPTVTCSPASGSTFRMGRTVVTCTATDDAGNAATKTFAVVVRSASEQIANVIALVESLNLKAGIENSLDAKLESAQRAAEAAAGGDAVTACNKLAAFVNEVEAQRGKALTQEQANQLVGEATRIRAVLGCA